MRVTLIGDSMRAALIVFVSLSTVVNAQTGRPRPAAGGVPTRQTRGPERPKPAVPPALPESVPPPVVVPFPPLMPPPTGGLNPGVVFTPPGLMGTGISGLDRHGH